MANEVKTIFTSEDKTSANAKTVADGIKNVGDQSVTASAKTETLADRLSKMNGKELAEKIMSITQNLEGLGDVMAGLADNDIEKFERGMDSAMRAAVSVVGLVAPQFAPLVAVMAPLVTRTLEWATGLDKAAEAQRRLAEATREVKEELKDQNTEIEYSTAIQKALSQDKITQLGLELEAIKRKMDFEEEAFLKQQALGTQTAEEIEAYGERINKLSLDQTLIGIQIQQEASKELLDIQKKGQEEREEAKKESDKKTLEADKDLQDELRRANEELIADINADITGHVNYVTARRFEGAKAAVQADKIVTDSGKKAAAEQEKLAEQHAQKMVSTASGLANTLVNTQGSLKDKLVAVAKQLTDMLGQELEKQLTAAIAGQSKQTASVVAGAATKKAAAASALPGQVAEAHAGIPFPLGPILAGLALVAFQVIASKVMNLQEGFVGDGRAPGLGRADDIDARINSRESVMNEGAPEAIGRAFLERANRGTLGDVAMGAAGAAGAVDEVLVRYENMPSDDTIVGQIMRGINVRVLRRNAELVASSFHSRSGKAL